MDLQKELLESNRKNGEKRSWRASVASLALHAMLISGIVYAGTHTTTHKVDSQKPIDAFISQGAAPPPPPPPPPPPAAKSSGSPKRATPKQVVEIPKPMTSSTMVQPVEIPKELPKVQPLPTTNPFPDPGPVVEEESTGGDEGTGDAVNGVVGGVEGGVAGGVLGGEVGGVQGGQVGGVVGGQLGGVLGGQVGGTGTGTEGTGTGGPEAPVVPEPPPPPAPPTGPLRVGGDVKAPVTLNRVDPNYTDAARKARIAGVVVVEAVIDKNGNVDEVKVIKGLPAGLAEEAEKAVRKWKFKPGTLNGQPVATIFNLTVTFKLE